MAERFIISDCRGMIYVEAQVEEYFLVLPWKAMETVSALERIYISEGRRD